MANGKIRFGKQSGGELALVIPDGVANTEVIVPESGILATKEYADLKAALADFTGTNVNKNFNGYQKLPGGLIIQWGQTLSNGSGIAEFTYPIAFPNAIISINSSTFIGSGVARFTITLDSTASTHQKAKGSCWNGDNQSSIAGQVGVNWLVIGY